MKKIVESIKKRPINLFLIIFVLCAYWINNYFLKVHCTGILKLFFVCYFNDLICLLFFFSYANLLLITVNREISKLRYYILISLCTSCVWEFIAPLLKSSSTTDVNDIVCYLIGGIFYWLILTIIKKKDLER